jgi:hypothetical protein
VDRDALEILLPNPASRYAGFHKRTGEVLKGPRPSNANKRYCRSVFLAAVSIGVAFFVVVAASVIFVAAAAVSDSGGSVDLKEDVPVNQTASESASYIILARFF